MISIDFYRPKYNIISTTKRKVFKIKEKCLRNNSSIFLANLTEWHSSVLEKKNILALQIGYIRNLVRFHIKNMFLWN